MNQDDWEHIRNSRVRCTCNGCGLNEKDWRNMKESRTNKALTELLRKKISGEDYDRIRKQTYGEYLEKCPAYG